MNWKKAIIGALKWGAFSAAAMVLLLIIVFSAAQTEQGRKKIAGLIASALSAEEDLRVKMGRLDGLIPFHVRVDRIEVGDRLGRWMTLEDAVLRWSPGALFRGQWHVEECGARVVEIYRLPKGKPEGERPPLEAPAWPAALKRLRLDRLAVEQLRLAQGVFGQRALFMAAGRVMTSPSGDRVVASLDLQRKDRPGTQFLFRAVLENKGPALALDLTFEEASRGLVASALGLRGPLSLSLQGEGPLGAWKGSVRVNGGELGELRSGIDLQAGVEPTLRASGSMVPQGALVPSGLRPWLGPEVEFDLRVRQMKDGKIRFRSLTLSTGNLALEMGGVLDLKEKRSRGRFKLVCAAMAPLGALAGLEWQGTARLEGRFSGPILRPRVSLDAELGKTVADRLRFASLRARVELDWLGDLGQPFPGLRLEAGGDIQDPVLRDSGPLPERALKWVLAAEGPIREVVHISRLEVTGEHLSARFSGRIHTKGPRAEWEGDLEIRDLRPFALFAGFDFAGSTRLKALIAGGLGDPPLSVHLKGHYGFPETAIPDLKPLSEKGIDYGASVSISGTGTVRISDMVLRAAAGSLTGEASLNLEREELQGSWRMALPELGIFSILLDRPVRGSLEATGRMEGSVKEMRLTAAVQGQRVSVEDISLGTMTANLEAQGWWPKGTGRLEVDVRPSGHRLEGSTVFAFEGDRLDLSSFTLKGPGSKLEGRLVLDLRRFLARGELRAECKDLSPFSGLLGEKIGGEIGIRAGFEIHEGDQKATIAAEARDLKGPYGEVGQAAVRGQIRGPFNMPRGEGTLEVVNFRRDDMTLDSLAFRVRGDGRRIDFTGRARGRYREALDMDVSGSVTRSSTTRVLRIEGLRANYGPLPLTLARPFTLEGSDDGLRLEGLAMNLGSGTLEGAGALGRDRIDLALKFGALPLPAAQLAGAPDLAGTATGEVVLAGSVGRPEAEAAVVLDGVRFRDARFRDIPALTVEARAGLKQGRLRSEFRFMGLTARPFVASVGAPLAISLSPFSCSLVPEGELRGGFTGDLDLRRIISFAGLDDQTLEGQLTLNLALEGTVAAPMVTGEARVIKGAYENIRTGTVLKDIEIEIAADTPKIRIVRAEGNDGGAGKVSAKGWLEVLPSRGFPFQGDLFLDQATLVRRDDATAMVDGQLLFSGSIRQVLLKGQITLARGEFLIPDRLPPEIVDLEVVDAGETGGEKGPAKAGPARQATVELDLTLKSPGRVFVRGRGLESEWQGEIRVLGKAKEPVATGGLSVVRGSFDFMGKRFDLKRGMITLDGMTPPSPRLDVLAQASGRDITAYLQLEGPINAPSMKLSSDPSLPSDEILARLLFGRSVTDITPIQAIQLANAVSVLAGGGTDFMGRPRKWLGIDQLQLKQSGENMEDAAISAGKYVSDNVYLEVEEGLGSESGKASVKWEVTPNITVETEAGTNAEGGVGIEWKWDY